MASGEPPADESPPAETPEDTSLEFTRAAANRSREYVERFHALFQETAFHNAGRRGSSCVDNTDYDAAWQRLLNPRPRPFILEIAAEVGLVLGGCLVGFCSIALDET